MTNEQWAMNNALYWGSLMRPRHPPQPRAAAPFQGGLVLIPLRRRGVGVGSSRKTGKPKLEKSSFLELRTLFLLLCLHAQIRIILES